MKLDNTKPLVSIIMNCHNGAKYLSNSIESILRQNYVNWELIFFDNMSSDESLSIAKSFNDKRIKVFSSKNFLNLYDARNNALLHIKGNYVCFLDTDDLWEKEKIQKQVDYLNKNKNFSMVYSNFYVLENDKKKFLRFKPKLPKGKITNDLLRSYTIGILTTCINAKIFKYASFDKNYNIIGDFDFFVKLSENSEIGCIQEPLATYRVHENNYSKQNLKSYIQELSNWLKKNNFLYKKKGISLLFLKYYLIKLKLKYFLKKFFLFRI